MKTADVKSGQCWEAEMNSELPDLDQLNLPMNLCKLALRLLEMELERCLSCESLVKLLLQDHKRFRTDGAIKSSTDLF